jgi:ribosomal protein S18 acetylase RimI-like enzyme
MPDDVLTAPTIRPYDVGDRDAVAHVCVCTAAGGRDARGVYSDDLLMPDVYALPYVEHSPDLAFVVVGPDGRVVGYVLGVADTPAFVAWWERAWTPRFRAAHPAPGAPTDHRPAYTEADLLRDGTDPRRMLRGLTAAELEAYPAHLHIDLLPEAQRQGLGRRLVDTFRQALAARGVPGLHLGYDPANTAARAFYDRNGFVELPSSRPDAPRLGITAR